jgi:hypothetical protein
LHEILTENKYIGFPEILTEDSSQRIRVVYEAALRLYEGFTKPVLRLD